MQGKRLWAIIFSHGSRTQRSARNEYAIGDRWDVETVKSLREDIGVLSLG